ncbi:MAG: hypothetical protein [Bacteriophage sp.]|nr:MAG: hypothetical protein [Bacteriophage sp.]
MCVKDTGTKYQLWISDFNIDGTFTRVHPFIISHTKTMTRTREDGKEEVFSACIKHDNTRYLGGNKNSSIVATKLQGRPRTGIIYDKANEFCTNRGNWITMIDYLEYCAIQALCYIEYANFDNQATLNVNLTSDGFKQGGLGAGVTVDNVNEKCYFIGDQANSNNFITEFDFRFGPYFVPNKIGTNKKLTIIGKEVMMDKIQTKLFVCFCLAVALMTVLGLALVTLILIGFGRILLLMSASLLRLSLIK